MIDRGFNQGYHEWIIDIIMVCEDRINAHGISKSTEIQTVWLLNPTSLE